MKKLSKRKIDCEEVVIQVPRKIMTFLRAMEPSLGQTVEEYLQYSVVEGVRADIDYAEGHGTPFFDINALVRRFKLNKVFKRHSVAAE